MRISDWSSDVCSSDLEFGTLAGFSFGAALMLGYSLHLGDRAMHEWGWRIPFLIAGPIGLIGMYVRSKMEDTPIFREEMASAERRHPPGLGVLIRAYWRPLLVVGGLVVALKVVNYSTLPFIPTRSEAPPVG